MRSIVAVAGFAVALAACGSSGGPAKTDGSSADHPAGMSDGAAGLGGGGTGAAGRAGASGASGSSGASGASGGASGLGGGAGATGGQGGAASLRDGGADARTDGGGCQSQNPDPCVCGRPDANSISATECAREKACRAAGGAWEPYVVFFDGGSYGPRCQSVDGSAFDAS